VVNTLPRVVASSVAIPMSIIVDVEVLCSQGARTAGSFKQMRMSKHVRRSYPASNEPHKLHDRLLA
jgi:hypothetical protein